MLAFLRVTLSFKGLGIGRSPVNPTKDLKMLTVTVFHWN